MFRPAVRPTRRSFAFIDIPGSLEFVAPTFRSAVLWLFQRADLKVSATRAIRFRIMPELPPEKKVENGEGALCSIVFAAGPCSPAHHHVRTVAYRSGGVKGPKAVMRFRTSPPPLSELRIWATTSPARGRGPNPSITADGVGGRFAQGCPHLGLAPPCTVRFGAPPSWRHHGRLEPGVAAQIRTVALFA